MPFERNVSSQKKTEAFAMGNYLFEDADKVLDQHLDSELLVFYMGKKNEELRVLHGKKNMTFTWFKSLLYMVYHDLTVN